MQAPIKRRGLADTVGFAHLDRQMDALMQRIDREDEATRERLLREKGVAADDRWRMAIAPHDDYAHVGLLYPLVLANIKAGTVVVFGVAHKARQLDLEDQLIFDSFTHWRGPYGDIAVSELRERTMNALPEGSHRVSARCTASSIRWKPSFPSCNPAIGQCGSYRSSCRSCRTRA